MRYSTKCVVWMVSKPASSFPVISCFQYLISCQDWSRSILNVARDIPPTGVVGRVWKPEERKVSQRQDKCAHYPTLSLCTYLPTLPTYLHSACCTLEAKCEKRIQKCTLGKLTSIYWGDHWHFTKYYRATISSEYIGQNALDRKSVQYMREVNRAEFNAGSVY